MFFFFKQKTAYELRISDWSSDVCSSDLAHVLARWRCNGPARRPRLDKRLLASLVARFTGIILSEVCAFEACLWHCAAILRQNGPLSAPCKRQGSPGNRSEEHTSELQSLMRISYAGFCLKKKNTTIT